MNPVGLPMLHLLPLQLTLRENGHRLAWDVGPRTPVHSQYPLEFVRKHFDEARNRFPPVAENPPCTRTSGQLHVPRDQIVDNLQILLLEQRLQVDGLKVTAFLGEIRALIENIRDAAAHARREIPAAR